MKLTDLFQVAPLVEGGQRVAGREFKILLKVRLDPPSAPVTPDRSGADAWTLLPTFEAVAAAFPTAARAKGVSVGTGVVDCEVAVGGVLADCRIAREAPAGLGFGEAALKLAPTLRLNPWTVDGRPVDGGRIRLPIQMEDAVEEPAPATP